MVKHFSYDNGVVKYLGVAIKPVFHKGCDFPAICEGGKIHKMHRLVWEIVKGPIPKGHCVIHKDGDKSNYKIENLMLHRRGFMPYANEKGHYTKLKGAHFHNGRWRARINKDGKQILIGMYDTAEEAHQAYMKKKEEFKK